MPNIDELFDKWSLIVHEGDAGEFWINKENFTKAIAEIISLPVEAGVIVKLADIEDVFNNEEHQVELDNGKLLREVENLINKSIIYNKAKILEDIRSKFSE